MISDLHGEKREASVFLFYFILFLLLYIYIFFGDFHLFTFLQYIKMLIYSVSEDGELEAVRNSCVCVIQ